MTHEQELCKDCGKRTEYMYQLNEGIFCSEHMQSALNRQRTKLWMESWKERIRIKLTL